MANLTLSQVWESDIYRLDYRDRVQGYTVAGGDGVANLQPQQLGNRTEYLKILADIAASTYELPLAALPYPTIATASHRLTVTPTAGTNGGRVAVSSGTRLTLAEQTVVSQVGRLRSMLTTDWQSIDMNVSSSYYLRAQISSGELLFYVQKGTDSDSIPGSLMGTPGGSSGGGFDSTPLDVLIAKVSTGINATVPTVCVFHMMPAGDFTASRPVISGQVGR